jgi:hypothetical protein
LDFDGFAGRLFLQKKVEPNMKYQRQAFWAKIGQNGCRSWRKRPLVPFC